MPRAKRLKMIGSIPTSHFRLVEVHYQTSIVELSEGKIKLYWFYIRRANAWVWDEDKLTYEEALKKYPRNKYNWIETVD